MATSSAPLVKVTPEQYLAMERSAEIRSEYFDGRIVAMAGTTRRHTLIVTKLLRLIDTHLDNRPCGVSGSDLKVWIPETRTYTYPDVSVVCDPVMYQDGERDIVTNPILIIEVLSPSTEKQDRQAKFRAYKSIPSFQQYVLVSQAEPWIEAYTRTPENFWLFSETAGLESSVYLSSIDQTIPLSMIYAKVEFDQ